SWPIDSNLATWVTTLAVNALAAGGNLHILDRRRELLDWLQKQQFQERHPYTGADPGGWAWTDLPGGVPDADDTPGALLSLAHLAPFYDEVAVAKANGRYAELPLAPLARIDWAVLRGLGWLLGLQNRDGGWP